MRLNYRFVEKYAEYQAKTCMGSIDQKGEITFVLPLDHFEKNPANHEGRKLFNLIMEEVNYGKNIRRFWSPPIRAFEDFNQIQSDPLQDFTIRNIKNMFVKSMANFSILKKNKIWKAFDPDQRRLLGQDVNPLKNYDYEMLC